MSDVTRNAAAVSNAPMLQLEDVCFSWPGHIVLNGVTLAVERGEVMCLMGQNGCGKSTLIDCVLGENIPSSGEIRLDGEPAAKLSAAERARIAAYVPQVHERTFPYTVEQMVLMGRTVHLGAMGAASDDDVEAVHAALATCGVERLAQRPCTELSGGEMQMVLLARALAQDTPLIVLDEPTAHLDFHNELVFLETVERLVAERGVTVFMATHSPNQAFHLAAAGLKTRVALMTDGCVAAYGAPADVLTRQNILEVFEVHALIADARDGGEEEPVRCIVPMHTAPRH